MKYKAISLFVLFTFQLYDSGAQYPPSKFDSIKELNYRELEAYKRGQMKYDNTQFDASIESVKNNSRNIQAQADYTGAYYQYYITNFHYKRSLFDWQLLSSQIIFAIVILIVLCGLFFSGAQFYNTTRLLSNRLKLIESGNSDHDSPQSQNLGGILKLSTQGVEVNSSVMGVIILVISIAFFFLYLNVVYPIRELGPLDKAEAAIEKRE